MLSHQYIVNIVEYYTDIILILTKILYVRPDYIWNNKVDRIKESINLYLIM